MIAPNSKIIILKSPIELDNNNQLTFNNTTSQYNYFYSLPKKELEGATFQRKDNIIRFETNEDDFTFDDVLLYNYCMYQNTSYGDKWFYAFIVNCTYVNNGVVALEIKTDVFQTWQFDITWKQSFVEREHIAKANDYVGANTIEENLEIGEPIPNGNPVQLLDDMEIYYCMAVSGVGTIDLTTYTGRNYNGVFSGFYYLIFDSISDIQNAIDSYSLLGQLDMISSLFIIPKDLVPSPTWYNWTVSQGGKTITSKVAFVPSSDSDSLISGFSMDMPITLDGYTPQNAKCYTHPYNYIMATNHVGNNTIYRWELCETSDITGRKMFGGYVSGVIMPGCSIKFRPYPYNKISAGMYVYDFGLPFQKLPICSWNGDIYTNYVTQNSVNIPLQLIGGGVAVGTGIMSGNPTTSASGILGIAQSLGIMYERSLVPNEVRGNSNLSDVNFSSNHRGITFFNMCCKYEMIRLIDNYFAMYGYATKLLKIPNTNNRSNWNYVKTINANLIGDIPQNDIQEIKELFNNGITLWHNSSYFLDYSRTNN